MIALLIIIAIPVVLALAIVGWAIATYNSFVGLRELVRNAMGQIAAQIESRWDAISSLINAARQYAEFESSTLTKITAQRRPLTTQSPVNDATADDANFATVLSGINALAENYPELKTSEVYINAMNAVREFENNVRSARMIYNDSATKLNRKVLSFPAMIIAKIFGFHEEAYFQNTASKAEMPSW